MAKQADGKPESIWTSANIITCVRVVFIPVFMVLALQIWAGGRDTPSVLFSALSFFVYVALSLTDKLDGYLARSRGEITDFGKFLDPIADKLLVVAALLVLMQTGDMNIWYVFIILVREFLVSAMRMVAAANGEVIAAGNLGKWKTASTLVALSGYFLYYLLLALELASAAAFIKLLADIIMLVAVVLTIASGVQYIWNARNIVFRV